MKFLTTDISSHASAGCYRIDVERGLCIEEYRGKVGLEELRSIVMAMSSDPCWSPDHHGLVDLCDAQLEMSSNDVLRLALTLRQQGHRSRGWRVFAVGSSVSYGIVRMLGYWSRNTDRFRIFQCREDAERWLERHRDQVPQGFVEPVAPVAAAPLRSVV